MQRLTLVSNEVRIIGGRYKGRKLRFPPIDSLRPTLGRVRETLFNWLASEIQGASCLDLFAGSGALGFEALSRGAAKVTFVERNRKARDALQTNLAALRTEKGSTHPGTAEQFLRRHDWRWDIVFFDPPYQSGDFRPLLSRILDSHLTETGLVYVERSVSQTEILPGQLVKEGRTGDCRFGLLART